MYTFESLKDENTILRMGMLLFTKFDHFRNFAQDCTIFIRFGPIYLRNEAYFVKVICMFTQVPPLTWYFLALDTPQYWEVSQIYLVRNSLRSKQDCLLWSPCKSLKLGRLFEEVRPTFFISWIIKGFFLQIGTRQSKEKEIMKVRLTYFYFLDSSLIYF